ncbi:MAG: hypothetical protein L0312_31200, partial [Acidobacteria bacterium]|nr:hypothetical protein [Acidobacteriota bacterium]
KKLAPIAGIAAAPFTGGASLWGTLASLGGQAAGDIAGSMAQNRGAKLAASLDRDQIATARQASERAERDDAWKKLLASDYTLGSTGYKPAEFTSQFTGKTTLPTFGTTGRMGGPSEAVRTGAQGLQAEVLKRLTGGPQLSLTDVDKMSRMGFWEKLANVAGPGLSIAGAVQGRPRISGRIPGRPPGISNIYSTFPRG